MIFIHRICRSWRACALPIVILLCSLGCDDGPQMYDISGTVTFGTKPIASGDIRFEPKEGIRNRETVAYSRIKDGEYATQVVGGPHWVYVRDLSGDVDMGSPGGKSLFNMEHRGEVDLPPVDQADSPVEQDIVVPTTQR